MDVCHKRLRCVDVCGFGVCAEHKAHEIGRQGSWRCDLGILSCLIKFIKNTLLSHLSLPLCVFALKFLSLDGLFIV